MTLKVLSHLIRELYKFTEVNEMKSHMFNKVKRVICFESTLISNFLKVFRLSISLIKKHFY